MRPIAASATLCGMRGNRRALITKRTAGAGGIASGLVAFVVGVGLLVGGGDQRANLVPFAVPVAILLTLGCLVGLRDAHRDRSDPMLSAGFVLTFAGLIGASAFYLAVGLSSIPPLESFLNSEAAEAIGTLLGSLLVMVVLPAGLLLLGIGFLRARVLSAWARPLPIVFVLVLAVGVAGVAFVEHDEVIVTPMVVMLGLTWVLLGIALMSTPERDSEVRLAWSANPDPSEVRR